MPSRFPPDVWRFATVIAGLPTDQEDFGVSWNEEVIHLHFGNRAREYLPILRGLGIPSVDFINEGRGNTVTGVVFNWSDVRPLL